MKKKSLTKRLVSFITAVGLTLTSTVMLIPASAEDTQVAGSIHEGCTGVTAGTLEWEISGDNHVLKCNAEDCGEVVSSHAAGTFEWTDTEGGHIQMCTTEDCGVSTGEAHAANFGEFATTAEGEHKATCTGADGCTVENVHAPAWNWTDNGTTHDATCENCDLTAQHEPDLTWDGDAENHTATCGACDLESTHAAAYAWVDDAGTHSYKCASCDFVDETTAAAKTTHSAGDGAQYDCTFEACAESNADTFKVTVDSNITNGTVTVEPAEATTEGVAAGTKVTLTVTPTSGNYEIAEVSYTADGGDKVVIEAADGAYTFTMPAAAVTVSATFNDVTPNPTAYTVTVSANDTEMGTAKIAKINGEATEATSAEAGDYVVIEAKENGGYEFVQWKVIKGNVSIETATTEDPNGYAQGTYFVMPAEEVEIQAEFKAVDAYAITIDETVKGTITATPAEKNDEGKVAEGVKVVLTATPDEGYAFNNEYTVNNGDVTVSTEKVDGKDVYYFIMPDSDVTVSATFYEKKDVEWVENADGSYTLTLPRGTACGDVIKNLEFDVTELLGEDDLLEDVLSISADVEMTTWAGFVIGANQGTEITKDDGSKTNWVNTAQTTAAGNLTLELNGGLKEANAQFQVWYAGNGTITVKNFKATCVEKYTVTIGKTENGTVKTDVEKAKEGDTVTVTVEPAKGYKVDTVTYTGSDGIPADVDETNDVYTFEMPDEDVTVTATFVKEDYDVTVTVNNETMGTAEADVSTAQMGDIVYLTAESNDEETYEFVEWKVVKGDVENIVESTDGSGFNFEMPAEDVEIKAIFKEIGSYFIKIGENKNGEIDVAETAKAGDKVTFKVTPADGYEIDQVTYSYNKAEGGVFAEKIEANEDGSYTITMPEADVTISATYTAKDYTVTVEATEKGKVEADKATANVGDTVTLTVTPDPGYEIETLKVTYGEAETEVTVTDNNTFEMPAANVTVTATFKAINYKITVASTENGTVEADKTTAIIDDTVTFTATPSTDANYVVKSYEVTYLNGEEKVKVEVTKGEDGKYTFAMPAADVTITVVFDTFVFELTDGKDTVYGDTWEEIAEAIKDGEYTITVNDAYEFDKKFALPKTAKSLTFTGEGKLTFTGTKLVVPVNTTFDVEIAANNTKGLIDISVAKGVTLTVNEVEGQAQFINKLTGTKTSTFKGTAVVNSIATFEQVENVTVIGGKATGIVKLTGTLTISGDKATATITEAADGAIIKPVINGTVIPKVTIDTFGKAVKVDVIDEEGATVDLSSGTTVLFSKNPIPADEESAIVIVNAAGTDALTAYWYKTKEIKAEVGTALTLTYGEGDSAFEKSYPNFDLLFEQITDKTVDYKITVNTDLTLSTKFKLPKTAKSITFDGTGALIFTGTKLAVPYSVTIGEGIVINAVNKKNAFDISVAKGATLTNNGTINNINKLSGTKTSILVGEYSVKNIATFEKVDGNVTVKEGKATNIIELKGGLAIYGAKATAAITTVDPGSEIKLIKVNNVLPKVTVEAIGEKVGETETITVTVYDSLTDNDGCDLASGTTILYAKKDNNFTDKIVIGNDTTGTMKAYPYGKEIRAEYGDAVSVDDLNTTENAAHEKDYQNLEAAVAAINAANDATANYEITLNKNIAPVKFELPKATAAASVKLVGEDAEPAEINVGKATSVTANTDLEIENIEFVTSGKTLTINAKKNLTVNELYGNVTAIKGGAKFTLTWVSENEATALVDITGFGTVEVCETLTIGKNFNVTKLVLGAEDSEAALIVSNVAAKASIKALEAAKGAALEYAEGAKVALAFTGKADAFVVDAEDKLAITGEVANGQAVLVTKADVDAKLADDIDDDNNTIEYGFTRIKNSAEIYYLGKVISVAVATADGLGEAKPYALWDDAAAAMNSAEADYVITLLDNYNANGAVKFPKAGTYKSVTITSDEGEKFDFTFTGNLALTAPTVFSDVNISAVKKAADAKYTINAGKNDITIADCDTGMLTAVKGTAKVNLSNVSAAGKVSAGTLSLSGAVIAKDGVTTKDLVIAAEGAKLSINQGKKIAVSKDVVLAEAEGAKGLEVTVLDKKTGEIATLKNGEVIGTVKGEYPAESIVLDQTAHDGLSLELTKGKLVVKGAADAGDDDDDKPASPWTESNGTYTFKSTEEGGGDVYSAGMVDLDKLLNGKSYADVKTITVDYTVTAGYVKFNLGINDAVESWKNTDAYENASGTATITLPNGVENGQDLQIQIQWANANSTAVFSNITLS